MDKDPFSLRNRNSATALVMIKREGGFMGKWYSYLPLPFLDGLKYVCTFFSSSFQNFGHHLTWILCLIHARNYLHVSNISQTGIGVDAVNNVSTLRVVSPIIPVSPREIVCLLYGSFSTGDRYVVWSTYELGTGTSNQVMSGM